MAKITKKNIRLRISSMLENTFSEYQQVMGKSRFKRKIKKASKVLASNLKDLPGNDNQPVDHK